MIRMLLLVLVAAPVPPGRLFLFILKPQQIPNSHAKELGNFIGRGSVEVFFSAHFQVRDNSSADAQLGAEFAGCDLTLGTEGGDAVKHSWISHSMRRDR